MPRRRAKPADGVDPLGERLAHGVPVGRIVLVEPQVPAVRVHPVVRVEEFARDSGRRQSPGLVRLVVGEGGGVRAQHGGQCGSGPGGRRGRRFGAVAEPRLPVQRAEHAVDVEVEVRDLCLLRQVVEFVRPGLAERVRDGDAGVASPQQLHGAFEGAAQPGVVGGGAVARYQGAVVDLVVHLDVGDAVGKAALGEEVQQPGERFGHRLGPVRAGHLRQGAVPGVGVGEAGGLLVLPRRHDHLAVVPGGRLEQLDEPPPAVQRIAAAHVVPAGALSEPLAQAADLR